MPDTASFYAIVGATFVLAGWIKGVVGMGLPTVAMGLLGLVMLPVEAAALLIVPSFVTNVWQLLAGPALLALLRRFAFMLLGICLGTGLGIQFLTGTHSSLPSIALGLVLAAYALAGLFLPRFAVPRRAEPWLSPLVGAVTGVLTGATGVFVVPAVPYLSALNLEKEELIQVLGLSFTVSTVALGMALLFENSYPQSLALSSLLAVIPAIAGMFLGQAVRNRLQPQVFRRWFLVAMLAVGAYMVAREVW